MRAGLQLYTVRSSIERDPVETLERVGEFGLDGVEIWDLQGQEPRHWRQWLDAVKLTPLSFNIDLNEYEANPSPTYRAAETLGTQRLVVSWLPPTTKSATIAEYVRRLQWAAARASAAGFDLSFHLHAEEYDIADDGSVLADRLLRDAPALFLQVDLGWAWIACQDLGGFLRRAAGRCLIVHIKDFARQDDRRSFTSVGEGNVPFRSALQAGVGIEWIVAEQDDNFAPDDMTAAARSCAALLALRDELTAARPG